MRTECSAALCIVLVVMSSTLSSCNPGSSCSFTLPRCTAQKCRGRCLAFAKSEGGVLKLSYCVTKNSCECELAPKKHLPLTTEVRG
ncbi:hypothetical protein SORBI_3005G174600 [Sorghum bicolor]|uniref:Knottin scorpion toxin-like domain-containing protein n=1 Tax=Sorghum bicolor TaxID=4558 RepID=A0A1B6PT52_SORBI|nr:hypothetical protein SORBI_3005G174600 [Sorghum bicolor]